jgi:hypothetical protein
MTMTKPSCATIATLLLIAVAPDLAAQTSAAPDVAVSFQGIGSWQPVDDTYVGPSGPYLDKGLGGIGPGVAMGVDVTARRFAFSAEYNWAAINVTQTGRLVSGTAEGQLRDSVLSLLAGPVWSSPKASIAALAGLSFVPRQPQQNGVSIDTWPDPAANEGKGLIAFTTGALVYGPRTGRVGLVASAKYSLLPRTRRAQELGVGPHVIRFGAGVRVRLTR